MGRNDVELRPRWMMSAEKNAVSELYQTCFGCPPPPDIFDRKLLIQKVVVYYEDKKALEEARKKIKELADLSKKFSHDEIEKIREEYSELILKAKLVVLSFAIYEHDAPRKRNTIFCIGATPDNSINAGEIMLDHLIEQAKINEWELAIAPGAVPESLRFLFPEGKLTPTEPAGTFLLTL